MTRPSQHCPRTSWKFLAVPPALLGWPVAAFGYIPPEPSPELAWPGPGVLCEAAFSFAAAADEIVVANPQLELWQPVTNTVKSPRGWFAISQIESKLARRGVGRLDSRNLAVKAPYGSVYRVRSSAGPYFSGEFAFVPNGRSRPSLTISFYAPGRAGDDWRKAIPSSALTAAEQRGVLARVAPPRPNTPDCLNYQAAAKDAK